MGGLKAGFKPRRRDRLEDVDRGEAEREDPRAPGSTRAPSDARYSHSIVPGGFDVMS